MLSYSRLCLFEWVLIWQTTDAYIVGGVFKPVNAFGFAPCGLFSEPSFKTKCTFSDYCLLNIDKLLLGVLTAQIEIKTLYQNDKLPQRTDFKVLEVASLYKSNLKLWMNYFSQTVQIKRI